jgi:REP element-mobilizing transposase RayT
VKSAFQGRLVLPKENDFGGWYSRGYFPHFDGEGMTQHVCFHLFDSLPQQLLSQLREELNASDHRGVAGYDKDTNRKWRKRVHEFLDSGYGSCFLRDERLASVVENALFHFDGQRYALHAWCVMPNHVHTLFSPHGGYKMSTIVHSWKSFTANQCNKILGRTGRFWEREPFDRYIRNKRHFHNALIYIEANPVKAGLCEKPEDWRWSSARRR